jgi:hypothetical protein
MCPETTTQKNSAPGVAPAVRPRMPWRVEKVQALDGYRLKVRFIDGLEGEVHMATLLHSPDAGVFAVLRDKSVFEQVFLQYGAVTWPGELDLAPDAMHDRIRAEGIWVPA